MLAFVGRFQTFPTIKPLHAFPSIAASFINPHDFKSSLIHSSHVFLPLSLHPVKVSNAFLQTDTHLHLLCKLEVTKPSQHLKRPCLTISATHTTPIHSCSSLLDILFLRLTPHIHLTIHLSTHSISVSFYLIGQVSLPYTIILCTQALCTLLSLIGINGLCCTLCCN